MKKLIASMLLGTAVAAVGCADKPKPAAKPATPAPAATTPADKPADTPPAK